MIRVVTQRDVSKALFEIEISGHADHGPHGQDVVCAAVSFLALATLNGLTEILKADITYEVRDGYIHFTIDEEQRNKDTIKALLDTFELGIQTLEEEHGKHVKLVKKEV